MDDREADEVTRHLVSCKQCRQLVAEARGTTDPQGVTTEKRDDRPLVKVRCHKCGARYGIPEERVRGRMLKIRCKNCSSIIEVWSSEGAIKSVIDRGKKHWFLVVKRERIGPMTEQEVRERFERGEIKAKTYAWRQGFSKWERIRDIPEFKELGGLTPTPRISAETTRKAPMAGGSDPDRTEKARPPRAYVRASEPSSEELNFDGLDSLAETAYRDGPGGAPEGSESGLRTAYVPPGSPPAADHQLTHIHLAQRQPREGIEVDGDQGHEMTSKFDAASEASWDRQFREASHPPGDPAGPLPDHPSPRMSSGEWEQHMKGQRRENSVLFSLAHLQNLAAAQAPREGRRPEGSNAILDIRPTLGPPASALMLPEEAGKRRSGVGTILGVAFLGIVLGAGVLLGILYLVQPQLVKALIAGKQLKVVAEGQRSPDAGPSLASTARPAPLSPQEPDAGAPAPGDSGAVDAAPPHPDAPRALAKAARVEPSKTVARVSPRRRHRRRHGAGGIEVVDPDAEKIDEPPEPAAPPPDEPPPEPTKPTPRPKPGGTELDRLIDDATGPGEVRKKPPPLAAPAEGGTSLAPAPAPAPVAPQQPKTLTREQVAAGMKRAEPGVHACYQQLREPGLVMITATINGATGRIAAARVVGGFAGTPSGECVVLAVRRACVFPRFSGPPLTLKYPYMLR